MTVKKIKVIILLLVVGSASLITSDDGRNRVDNVKSITSGNKLNRVDKFSLITSDDGRNRVDDNSFIKSEVAVILARLIELSLLLLVTMLFIYESSRC